MIAVTSKIYLPLILSLPMYLTLSKIPNPPVTPYSVPILLSANLVLTEAPDTSIMNTRGFSTLDSPLIPPV